jgi:phosphate starvation-inducible PhoH-like protein
LKPKPVELTLAPPDNQRLANLCGALDENLRQIEIALEVTIARRGDRFTVRGDTGRTARDRAAGSSTPG